MRALLVYSLVGKPSAWPGGMDAVLFSANIQRCDFYSNNLGAAYTWRDPTGLPGTIRSLASPDLSLTDLSISLNGYEPGPRNRLSQSRFRSNGDALRGYLASLHSLLRRWSEDVRTRPQTMNVAGEGEIEDNYLPTFEQDEDGRMLTPLWDSLDRLVDLSLGGSVNLQFWV